MIAFHVRMCSRRHQVYWSRVMCHVPVRCKFLSFRSTEEVEEYQRVSTHVGKGLAAIQEELHRMRMATKAQVDSLAIKREVPATPTLCCSQQRVRYVRYELVAATS